MIICPNCGAENLFDGATQCKKCQTAIGNTNQANTPQAQKPIAVGMSFTNNGESIGHDEQLSETQPVQTLPPQAQSASEQPIDFDIKEVSFDDGATQQTSENQPDPNANPMTGESSIPAEYSAPETIEKELTLYRDDELQVRMEQTENGPAITLTNRTDFDSEDSETIQRPDSIIPALSKEDLAAPISEEQGNVTNKIIINPNLEKRSHFEQSPRADETPATGKVQLEATTTPEKHHEKPSSEFLDKISGEQFKSKGVAYYAGNTIRVIGQKLVSGEPLKIGDKEYELKPKPANNWPLYGLIGGGVLLLAMLAIFVIGSNSQSTGQIVGILKDPNTGQLYSNATVTIKELGKKAQISSAGFFVFDNVPEGIYTLEIKPDGYDVISERLTVVKHLTSAAGFSLPKIEMPTSTPAPVSQNIIPEITGNDVNGQLKLTLSPANSKVYLDGRFIGTGSQTFRIVPGKHRLTLKSNGYKDENQDFEMTENGSKALTLTLEKGPPAPALSQPKGNFEIAAELEGSGKFSEAITYYQNAIRQNPANAEALIGQARCYRAKGDSEESLASYLKAAKAASDRGDVQTQLTSLSGVLEINPNYMSALYNRGSIYFAQGNYNAAANDFSKVIEIDNRHLNAHYKLAEAYYKSKNYPAAIQIYDKTLSLNFADPKPYAYIAEIYVDMGDIKNAKKFYDKFEKSADISTRNKFGADPEWQRVKTAIGK